ncbi:MAG TPA: efflux RND transporter permease subunit [Thermoanaerobaculia bacterium]|jgi:cobalt-zinc-cadmium resistance protein CzcA|nr:efflux RND transporter permease subunit [Thermoanaerobaculia bacterium]
MIDRIVTRSFAKPVVALLLVVPGAILGAVWLRDLRRDVFPDLSAPVFNVIVQNASMGAEELEIAIAIPMEAALNGLPGVRRIRSSSQLGVASTTIEFEPDADYYRSRQLVAERVAQASTDLPPGTDTPLLSSLTGRLNEIFEFTLEAEAGVMDAMSLRDLAEFEVRNRLLAVPGVAAVERLGGYLRQFQVQIDPNRMSARGITLAEVMHAVESANKNASGGFVVQGPMEWNVRAIGMARSIDDLRATVVAVRATTPVLLGDVADVREAPAVRRGIAHRLKGEVVSCRISKQFDADTVKVAAGVRQAFVELQKSLPKGVQLRIVYDQSELVQSSLSGVGRAVLLGAFFVVLVLFALLGDIRAAMVVTFTIPLSLGLAGVLLHEANVGLNTMTLGGLAIAVGLLVDAAIIVTENVVHRLTQHRGADRKQTALAASLEVARPITFATLIVIAVFAPLFAMTGIEGRMYEPLAAAVIAAVAASLVLALTLVPLAAGLVLRPRREGKAEDVWIIRRIKARYAPMLDWCMAHAGLVRVATLAITIPALALAFAVGSDFMPQLDEGAFLVQTILPPEASLDEVDRLNHRVEDLFRAVPEVEDVVRRTGRAERTEDPMPHTISDVLVVLKKDRRRSLDEIERDMRERTEHVPGVSILFTTPLGMRIDEGLGGTPADLSVRVFGPNLDALTTLGDQVKTIMSRVEGIADLRAERMTGLPQLRIEVDRAATARVGLTPGDVIDAVRIGMVGEVASSIWVGQRNYDLVVRLQDDARDDVEAIGSLLIDGHDGSRIPLNQLATITKTFGPGAIRREAGSRRIAVEASVEGRDLGGAAREVRERLERELKLPAGYFVNVGGRVESQERATRSLLIAIAVAVFAVFLLLYLALGSTAEALVILATLPDAFVGGIVALLIAGESWNVSSLVGLIGLFGIAVQNGLVLIAQVKGLMAEGAPFDAALREASIGRVRPKLMTACTAILGLLPLLVLRLHGTEVERPLAIVMIGGLVTSTLFTLFALPTFYAFVNKRRVRLSLR